MKQIGVRIEPRFVEWGSMMVVMGTGDFDALVNHWEEPARVDLEEIWHSPLAEGCTLNFGRYSNPEVDRLLDEVADMAGIDEQKPLFDRIQEIIVADQPYTFLVENARLSGVSARIQGAEINAATPYFSIDEWYVVGGDD